jgi:hypothetical protein
MSFQPPFDDIPTPLDRRSSLAPLDECQRSDFRRSGRWQTADGGKGDAQQVQIRPQPSYLDQMIGRSPSAALSFGLGNGLRRAIQYRPRFQIIFVLARVGKKSHNGMEQLDMADYQSGGDGAVRKLKTDGRSSKVGAR